MTGAPLLDVRDLAVTFPGRRPVRAVDGVSFALERGETLAVVGESGSGKSVTSLAVMGLIRPPATAAGSVRLEGRDLAALTDGEWQGVRGERMAMIFQEPLSSLNPSLRVGYQIAEMFRRHRGEGRRAAREKAVALMTRVGIPDAARRVDAYPHEFSGGMRQRIMIATALALDPDLIIADEPTTALDVTVQAQVLRLLAEMQRERGLALILISHDLGVVARIADRVAVMYAGRIVERGAVADVYRHPAHPYTLGLMGSVPSVGSVDQPLRPIAGSPPDPAAPPAGCAFHPRCPLATDRCRVETPAQVELGEGRASACHYAEEVVSGAR